MMQVLYKSLCTCWSFSSGVSVSIGVHVRPLMLSLRTSLASPYCEPSGSLGSGCVGTSACLPRAAACVGDSMQQITKWYMPPHAAACQHAMRCMEDTSWCTPHVCFPVDKEQRSHPLSLFVGLLVALATFALQ